ncbi:MAG: hypothetical protein H6760_00495 [Candidatus Nomurabacteria bacterium]|nr:MAG: hypothetical protein H6760_00495 [Candidatus Nomurabacteria bacterium]
MEQATSQNTSEQEVYVAGLRLSDYWRMARWPVAAATLVNAALLAAQQPWPYLWGINVLSFLGLAYWLQLKKRLTFGSASAMGIVAGLSLGFFVAIFRLVIERHAYLFFNLITEPLLTAAGGFLFSTLLYSLLHRKPKKPATDVKMRKEVKTNERTNDQE